MEQPTVPVVIVAALSKKHRTIGKDNGLLWHVPEDMKRFKRLTFGHPVIMGRKTFESILAVIGRPLPGRTNIVVTRNPGYHHEGTKVAQSLNEAFALALEELPAEIHIGGGEELYRQALPYVSRLHLTLFDDEPAGDAHFPEFIGEFAVEKEHAAQEYDGLTYQWVDYVRK